jgi:hypothetical protein
MAKPQKTAAELERMILAEVQDFSICEPGIKIKVVKIDGRWEAFSEFPDHEIHPDCVARVALIAAQIRTRFDLAD